MVNPSTFVDKLQRSLIGRELSSVTFVRDYVQLDFNGPGFTFFIWPKVLTHDTLLSVGEAGYRNILCSQIGRKIKAASFEQADFLALTFGDETTFRVSLRDQDYVGPEALHFISGTTDDSLVVF